MASLISSLSVSLTVCFLVAWPEPAMARRCGGSKPCRCGDVVVTHYTLSGNLGPCEKNGLVIAGGVTLDCEKHTIRGSGEQSENFGLALRKNATDVVIKNCAITGFQRGIRLKDTRKNKLFNNTVYRNGNFSTQVGYGIDVAKAQENLFQGNFVHHNADEGIHVGTGSHGNTFLNNRVEDNGRENFYFLSADRGVLRENRTRGGGSASVFIKHSAFLRLEKNMFYDEPVILRGNAHDNLLIDNEVTNAGIRLQPYEEQGTLTHPSRNMIAGGKISGASECISIVDAGENTIKDVLLSNCGHEFVFRADSAPMKNTLIGMPFNAKTARLDEKSVLQVGWRLTVLVKEKNGKPAVGATVRGVDAKRQALFEAVTDANGTISPQEVIELTWQGREKTRSLPLTLHASSGEKTIAREINVTKHTTETLTLP